MAKSPTTASINFTVARRSRWPLGSIQNFIASANRKTHGTHLTREPNMGGNVKSNAAASQSSGRRGILLSLLLSLTLLLLLMLMLLVFQLEQTECPQALVKMRLPDSWGNFNAWQ